MFYVREFFTKQLKKRGGRGSEGVNGKIAKTVRINLVIRDSTSFCGTPHLKWQAALQLRHFFWRVSNAQINQ